MIEQAISDWAIAAFTIAFTAFLTVATVRILHWRNSIPITEIDAHDDAVILVDAGRIVEASALAREGYGASRGARLDEVIRSALGASAGPVLSAISQLESGGSEVRLRVHDKLNRAVDLVGAPHGGQLRVVLRDVADTQNEVVETGPKEAPPAKSLDTDWSMQTFAALLEDAPLLAWSRDSDGNVNWAGGQITVQNQSISARQAVDMVVARQSFAPAGNEVVRRTRLEFGDNDPVALHAIETTGSEGMISGYAVDATLTATVERTLTRFIQTMTETFAHLTVGLAIFDRNHRLVLFNPTLADMWEIDAVWLARRPDLREILDRLRANRRIPDVANYHEWRDHLLALFEDPEAVDYEESWDLASGARIRVMARPHPHGALAFVFDDVTEQLQLETRYRHMDDLLTTALERLDEGLIVFGSNGLLRFVNSAFHKIWDTDAEAVCTGMHAKDVFDLCSRLSVEAELWDRSVTFATGEERRTVWAEKVTLATGLTLRVRFAPLPGGSTLVVFTDMSDSENAAQALRDRSLALESVEEMRRAVLDQISHKLRTPLNSIFGFGQLLSDPRFGELNMRQQSYARGIIEAAEHLLDTVKDVAELAALEAPRDRTGGDMFAVEDAVNATHEVLLNRAISAGVDFVRFDGPAVGRVARKSLPLRQILFYLAADAIQRAERGSKLVIGAEKTSDGWVSLFVAESPPDGGRLCAEMIEIVSPVIPLVRRLSSREGGRLEIVEGEDGHSVRMVCSFNIVETPDELIALVDS